MKAEYNPDEGWQNERMLSPKGYRRNLERLGLTIAQAGRWLGVSKRTGYRYATGETVIPTAVVLTVRAFIEHHIKPVVPPRR